MNPYRIYGKLKEQVLGTLLDLQKTFDSLDRKIHNLYNYSRQIAPQRIQNYFQKENRNLKENTKNDETKIIFRFQQILNGMPKVNSIKVTIDQSFSA